MVGDSFRREEVVLDPKTTKSDTMQLFLPKKSLPAGLSYTLRFEGRCLQSEGVAVGRV